MSPNPARIGQRLTFQVRSVNTTQPLHLAVFIETPDGRIEQILPNRLAGGQPMLRPGETLTYPANGASYVLTVDGTAGTNTVLAYATPKPLNLDGISDYGSADVAFATVRRQGKGEVEASFTAILRLHNPGLYYLTKFTVQERIN